MAPYYQKEGESPVICYLSSTKIEGYYLNSKENLKNIMIIVKNVMEKEQ